MPLPWKKVKSTRISQLVNDHLHKSQKRRDGSSLVVETGFPTSLIDLFIKNREKLKKPSKKKRHNPPNTPVSDTDDPVYAGSPVSISSAVPPPSPVTPPSIVGLPTLPTQSPLRCPSPLRNPSVLLLPYGCVSKISVVGSSGGETVVGVDEKEYGDAGAADVNRVLLGVLKMFLVVVLALGTKRLTVGITISAFLLFFLEYVGKHVSGLSKVKGVLGSMAQSVSRLFKFKEAKLEERNCGVLMLEQQEECSTSSRCLAQEIQVVKPKGYLVANVQEIQPENEIMEASCFEERLGCQEIELMEVVMEKEESICGEAEFKMKSRRAKIKSKIKKFVPKKLRCSRKEHDLQRPEIVEDDSAVSTEEQVDQCKNTGESENASELSSIAGGSRRVEDSTMRGICACDQLLEVNKEADVKRGEKGHEIEAGLTLRHLVLCLIVLIGLIGGRAFALLLTLSWFLLLKLGEALARFRKVPVIKSFDKKSG